MNAEASESCDRFYGLLRWTRVKVVYREILSNRGGELPHIARQIDGFLNDLPRSSLHEAYEHTNSLHCMQLLAAHKEFKPDVFYRDWEFDEVSTLASTRGDLQTLMWLIESYLPDGSLTAAANAAAASGNLQVLEWIYEVHRDRASWGGMEWCAALRGGQAHVIEWLQKYVAPHTDAMNRILHDAAKAGYLDVVEWLLTKDESGASAALLGASKSHQWGTFRWIATNFKVSSLPECVNEAAKDGNLEFLQWLHAKKPIDTLVHVLPIATSDPEVLEWICKVLDPPLTAKWMDQAASDGHLEVVKWLDAHHCLATTRAMDDAASAGFLEVVQWLHENRREGCTPAAMNRASENGHLNVVKWLHSVRRDVCSVFAMEKAAGSGHLDVVQWLHSHRDEGCTKRAMDWAAKSGHLDVVKWLHENRSEGCTSAAMNWAAYGGHLNVIQWLHNNRSEGCTSKAMDLAAAGGHLDVLKWLHANRTEGFTSAAIDMAAAGGHLHALHWLKSNGAEVPSPNAMRDAVLGEHVPVMLYLYKEYGHDCCEAGISLLSDAWEDVEIRFVGTARWLLETFGEKLAGVIFRVNRADWATNKWLRGQNVTQLEIEDKFVFWECD